MEAVSDIQKLIRVIGSSKSKFSSINGLAVEIEVWDGRIVRGSNYKGPKGADVISVPTENMDSNLLWPHVKSLLKTGKSFIVRNGQVDDACLSEWTISDN